MNRLVGAGLLFQRGTPPEASYVFKHALVQDAAYGTLLRKQRQQLHQDIAQRLEQHDPAVVQGQPELLAHHCSEAGLHKRAIVYWTVAASVPSAAPPILKRSDIFAGPSRCLKLNLRLRTRGHGT